ncbi:hypothetical protein EAH81_20160 [Flavobacterium pectinovorum]|jgi:hypothetical protein|uniref:Uncharacterized protein n=1 Tax=Flavobacterium pectinovorum TaxID=29533 RepID=A0A502EFD7_9FLAO|nr:hypothetical protein EAH81_20160 [Flavobacterium pectinovorum]
MNESKYNGVILEVFQNMIFSPDFWVQKSLVLNKRFTCICQKSNIIRQLNTDKQSAFRLKMNGLAI